jgi:integrase
VDGEIELDACRAFSSKGADAGRGGYPPPRKCGRPLGAEVEAKAKATGRSWVRRRFKRATEAALTNLMARDLSGLDVALIIIDGVDVAGQCVVVALAITTDGNQGAGRCVAGRRRLRQADMLTMDDVIRLLDHIPERYQAAVWLLVYTGMRPAELCGLRIRDVDFTRRMLTVNQTLAPVAGYDAIEREHRRGSTKSEAGQRSIPLPRWLCEDLAAGLAARGAPLSRDAPLIVNKDGRPVNRDTFRARIIRPALRAAGLPDDFRTCDFRHAHASMLIEDGADVLAVAERMGHTDPAVTLRVYGHLFDGVQAQLTDRLERRRQGARGESAAQVVDLPATAEDGGTGRGPRMGRGGPRNRGL